jgi:integrase
MPRRPQPPDPPPRQRRRRNTGSISVDSKTGEIRVRPPKIIDPEQRSKEFPPGHMADAEAYLAALLNPPPAPTAPPVLVETWGGIWWKTYVEPFAPPNTARGYLYALGKLRPVYGTPLVDLRPSMLQSVVGTLAAQLDAGTVQGIVGVWRRCLEAAVNDELIARNPAKPLVLPKLKPKTKRRHISPNEALILRDAIVNHRFEAAYALLLGCGLRIGEVLGLAWEHVDLVHHRAWIQRQWTNSHWRDLPKGRNPRWVRLPPAVVAALIRHRNEQPPGSVLVMQSPYGRRPGRGRRKTSVPPQPWSYHAVVGDLIDIVDALELPPATPHAYRRGLVTVLIDGGAPPSTVAEMVGHADSTTTMRSYAMPSDAGAQLAAELVDRYLGVETGDSGTETAC